MLDYTITRTDNPTSAEELSEILANPGFGKHFTDHMVTINWTEEKGWHDAQVRPYGPMTMEPASNVFHYGQAIFEGIKAYRQPDDSIATFRPDHNAQRFINSAERLAMPELPQEEFIESLRQLVEVDKDWVPEAGGEAALYLRPFMISTEVSLGVHPAKSYRYVLIASPAGSYFSGGIKPVSVWLSTDYVRAAPGGTGAAKFAGNYAGSLLAQAQADEKGCDQVVWLDAIERRYIEEMGGMNLMFVYGSGENVEIVTPELSGSLLPGITRESLLQVAQDLGYKVTERRITAEEWQRDAESGAMSEAFACGTAAVITPVGHVLGDSADFQVNGNEAGEITMTLREHLTGIQRGAVEDTHGWLHTLVK
ncbi:branched-chain amino acid aminotransferase [Corynebacterium kefirresidentii]|uniref:branched-chain amino acid aminotransferase n=1 Tax=Corynebacterium TaxID=1716 RepID=UPI0003B7F992|nr:MULTISPECIES: branched-chain amino acid aminotransferase [Corynebacterium]WKS53862.1 branched-chain amino acid aminotransferase [Corynebacterium tuberculostearicum]ERS47303.1 branched-chain amino acid aminotransferase [Corynebacterium sp. KPL1856]ERS47320.1 branched-chain amino acid aminotransferase [Corynebacterium sp. KPL1860]ERS57565.1 branched-chain amino acid aminotransferase [Corynebacterium sp. KPL1821]ERS62191.1 branched-chain amino acid aminotransferase [Corynebacterium sp. KPL1817